MGTSRPESGAGRLSRRELEVAALVADGLTNRDIANRLFISERTVDGHLEHIREKLEVNTRAQVAAWVVRQESGNAPSAAVATPASRVVARPRLVAHPRMWTAAALVLALLAAGVGVLRLTAPPPLTIHTIAGIQSTKNGQDGDFTGDGNRAIHASLNRPSDVEVGSDGAIYIADYGNQAIRRIVGGVIGTMAGRGTDPLTQGAAATNVKLQFPSSLALDPAGNLNILMTRSGSLEVWAVLPNSTMSLVVSLGHSRGATAANYKVPIGGLAIAADGTMYIADRTENRVWRRTPDGQLSIYAGSGAGGFNGDHGAATEAALSGPMGLALDQHGNLFIADTGNNRIRKVDPNRIITTVAGSGTYYDDRGDGGPATDARLGFAFGIAAGRDGTIYIADTGNNRVRKITPSGLIEAVAGTGRAGFWGDDGLALDAEFVAPEAITLDPKGGLLIADAGNHRIREVLGVSN
jgi:DNA-binding CsgD family transcriptional regulator/sugar lactone lactonase YvrE